MTCYCRLVLYSLHVVEHDLGFKDKYLTSQLIAESIVINILEF
jgi:hypothetical protein